QGAGAAHPEDVRQGDLEALLAREVDSHQTCHVLFLLLSRRPDPTPRRPGALPSTPRPPSAGGRLAPVVSSLLLWCPRSGRCPGWAAARRGDGSRRCRTGGSLRSALALLVTGVRADHHDACVATDHLAAVTDRL